MNSKILILGLLMMTIFTLFSGCSSDNCLKGEDKNITVFVVENIDHSRDMGLTYRHNVTINIANIRDTPAKNVEVTTGYCNDFIPKLRKCENRTFSITYIPPNGEITRFFEYDRNAAENALDGKYQLQYKVESCLPLIITDNKVFVSQR